MSKISPSTSLLLMAVLSCSWLMATTAEENIKNPSRTERQYSLNGDYAVPYYGPILELPSFSYNTETRAPNYLNRPFFTAAPAASGERTFQTLVNLLSGRPLCPACPTCPTCPSCPTCPVMSEQAISVSLPPAECLKSAVLDSASAFLPCSRVLAAPKGSIEITFTAEQSIAIGIVAVAPNTQISLTCTTISTVSKTQDGAITANKAVISKGFVQIVATGANATPFGKLVCTWVSS
ncbi:uncharacterized protein LOC124316522 [Daphnia pulicaria]|uniref:uncharacterized protein LOC124316522 n=1 Tax=Daphnia pulicaria TaxID=35523 RepID=UPI001EEA88BF|nr:uncharacterized protein LOC124316522 [Daphnia pulicaria]XP_046638471.1 uncharacterized protein LOC124316522 [Daphnia pulicaria]